MSHCFFVDLMAVYFNNPVFTGSESSGKVTVSMTLVRSTIMNDEITVVVIPSEQSPLSAQGKRCIYCNQSPLSAQGKRCIYCND